MHQSLSMDVTGYYPGVIGHITSLHADYYHTHWGFDRSFEIQVGTELCQFIECFDGQRDGFWSARIDGRFAGAMALDGSLIQTEGARIRWFIVDPRYHGAGLGGRLLDGAMAYCRQKAYGNVFLWTFKGLDAARFLYEKQGFKLVFSESVSQWGCIIEEQKFEWHA